MGEFIAQHGWCIAGYIIAGWILEAIKWWWQSRTRKLRAEAIESGVAEWVVTGSNGETEFRWIEPQQAGGSNAHSEK